MRKTTFLVLTWFQSFPTNEANKVKHKQEQNIMARPWREKRRKKGELCKENALTLRPAPPLSWCHRLRCHLPSNTALPSQFAAENRLSGFNSQDPSKSMDKDKTKSLDIPFKTRIRIKLAYLTINNPLSLSNPFPPPPKKGKKLPVKYR